MNSQGCDYILILTVLIHVVAESREDVALRLAQAKFDLCSMHGVQSAVLHLLSRVPIHRDAAASCLRVQLCPEAPAAPVQPLGFKKPQPGSLLGQQSNGIFLFPFCFLSCCMTPRCVSVEKGHLWSSTSNTHSEYIYSAPRYLLVPQNWNPHQHQTGNVL